DDGCVRRRTMATRQPPVLAERALKIIEPEQVGVLAQRAQCEVASSPVQHAGGGRKSLPPGSSENGRREIKKPATA
ncbi:MAG: hypothetical protein ACE5NA_01395, partial [Nitrospiraceae bacterium]